MGQIKHTWHPNTFGLLYGRTTKTACSKRRNTNELVKPLETTCPECQETIIQDMREQQESYMVATEWAREHGYTSVAAWVRAINLKHKEGKVSTRTYIDEIAHVSPTECDWLYELVLASGDILTVPRQLASLAIQYLNTGDYTAYARHNGQGLCLEVTRQNAPA